MDRPQPNILLITTDQQRHDTLGTRKPGFLRTPHLDLLARQGTTFTRAYADCPVCVPSRVSITTGRSAFGHGMAVNGKTSDCDAMTGGRTLPARLGELGYQTAAIGKMHFGPQRARHGFQEMIPPDDYYRAMARDGATRPMRHGLGQNELYPGLATVPEWQTLTAWTVDQCVDYVRERRDPAPPFFLWCSFAKPHPPLDPPEPYYSMYRDSPIPEPVYGDWATDERAPPVFRRERQSQRHDLLDAEVLRAARAAYYGLVTQIDYNIGRLWAALREAGVDDNTLIVFASDHGEYLGDHWAGAKRYFHEPSAHIPMLLRPPPAWEGHEPGTVDDRLVTLPDILPTLVCAAGGSAGDVEGRNLLAPSGEEPSDRRETLEFIAQMPDGCASLGITDGRWKYLWYPEGGVAQLFDLASDPDETTDLAARPDSEDRCRAWHTRLEGRIRERDPALLDAGGRLPGRPIADIPETRTRAKNALGLWTEYVDKDVRH